MILIEDLSFSYSPSLQPIFKGFDLEIKSPSWVALIGPEGSGKTTLGKLIKGLLKPDSGVIKFGNPQDGSVADVGYLGGDPYDSLVGISVEEDIVFGLENMGFSPTEMKARVERALQWMGLSGMTKRLVHTLSGGEQQKVALAGTVAMGCRTLILDEALSMLDRPTRLSIRALIASLVRNPGLSVVEVTHDLEDALTADRILFLSKGKILFDGRPENFIASQLGREWISMTGGATALRSALLGRPIATQGCRGNSKNIAC